MSKRTGTKVQKNRTDDEFIMLPTVDFCFKELMQNEKVRKGIIAALLGVRPEDQNEEGIIRWMRFLNAKSRKELKEMAKQDEYFGEAYEELERLSADEKKRLEYETRLKYKRDKYAQLHYATRIGREEGERIGREEGAKQINELHKRLIELGKIDDLKRAVEDSDYQGRLLKELKL